MDNITKEQTTWIAVAIASLPILGALGKRFLVGRVTIIGTLIRRVEALEKNVADLQELRADLLEKLAMRLAENATLRAQLADAHEDYRTLEREYAKVARENENLRLRTA